MKSNQEGYVIPELEIRVTPAWVRLVRFCQTEFPNGDLKIRIVNCQPTELLERREKIRFDKEMTLPGTFEEP